MIGINAENLFDLVNHQIGNFWTGEAVPKESFNCLEKVLSVLGDNFRKRNSTAFQTDGMPSLNTKHSVQYMLFLYYYAHQLYVDGDENSAETVYYLNKIMHANDWFYAIDLPIHFGAEHPLNSVLGRASYGDYLFIYQGVTIGGNRKDGELVYPQLGNNVLLYSDSKVLGDTQIGDNVIISANSYLKDEKIPDNCIVFGSSPNIMIKQKTKEEIIDMTSHIWKFDD